MSIKVAHSLAVSGSYLRGTISVPGDKSISHRSLILSSLSVGESKIHGLLEGADVMATVRALREYGAVIRRGDDAIWSVNGVGVGGLMAPREILHLGNSGTGVRLLLGLAATHDIKTVFTGDVSLRQRPMQRVIEPLHQMGARFEASGDGNLPITVVGTNNAMPIEYALPVSSAQIKSAVLLAGLNAPGSTKVVEKYPSRDHTEHLLRHFGARVSCNEHFSGSREITLSGRPELIPQTVLVPGDPSSAAFPIAAALLIPGSKITITGVGLNPLRAAFIDILRDMGARIIEKNCRKVQGEPVADLSIYASPLHGIEVPSKRAPAMIDEYPTLAMVAAFASGTTIMRGISELRVKESDRISAMANGLGALGVRVEELSDGLIVHGHAGMPPSGKHICIDGKMDHRIVMSFLVYGLAAQGPVRVNSCEMIDTSFPGFEALMHSLGACIVDDY